MNYNSDINFFLPQVHTWNVHYTILLHDVMETALTGPRQPIYSAILDLDRQIRDFDVPLPWRMQTEDDEPPSSPEVSMYRWLVLSAKEIGTSILTSFFLTHA